MSKSQSATPAIPATPETDAVEIVPLDVLPPAVRGMVEEIRGIVGVGDSLGIHLSILEGILASEDTEALLAEREGLHGAEDYYGVPIEIVDFEWRQSTKKGAANLGFYAVVECVNFDTGEKDIFSIGGLNVCAQLYRARQLGSLPMRAVLTKASEATGDGNYPQWLRPWSQRETEVFGNRFATA